MHEEESRIIPDERDQIDAPHRPDLRCAEHEACYELLHALLNRVIQLESQVATLEKESVKCKLNRLKTSSSSPANP